MTRAISLLPLLWVAAACNAGDPAPPRGGPFAPDGGTSSVATALCSTARASEDLTPRADLTGIGLPLAGGPQLVHTSDLFVRFRAICGGCHVDATNGGRHVDESSFATTFDATWLAHITSDDPAAYMPPPPNGKPFSSRPGNDPVVQLVAYLQAWLGEGRPRDVFTVEGGPDMTSSSGYTFTPDVAAAMTNLGNCVPDTAAYASSTSGMMESLDAFFENATALPSNLSDTDLTSFDSSVLAATGVIAFVPAYPLWSDGSGKLRHIRVPRGQTVTFDKARQAFDIPPNTRFYKTFFRKVVDRTGHVRNRKMETRLIVARPDETAPDGTTQQTALFGTYVWSDDETSATLANLPYRDGTTHADQVRTYITDELAYQDLVDAIGPGADFEAQLEAALAQAVHDDPNLQRHYAIPGRLRCVQCHMGSPSRDFVLGFFPLQIARRPNATGGTYEPTGDDELTQLQRLIDYGVISGMTSPADVLPLEHSQGARQPRTDGELKAQAYMVGNCAHCHNPRGLPSVTKPELATAINFMPDPDSGGIFEMSLERMSPIRSRGASGDIAIPYITPSLRDYPVATYPDLRRVDNGVIVDPTAEIHESTWTPKYFNDSIACDVNTKFSRAYCGASTTGSSFVPAPWRSLIYRNVDSPFPYFDDYVPFPHMPMNTPGFDCRLPRIMGDWMVGLPAVRKNPLIREDALPQLLRDALPKPGDGTYDSNPQPYEEVKPDDPRYAAALALAAARLAEYHAGVRYRYCQDVLSPDIFDPITPASSPQYKPNPTGKGGFLLGNEPPDDPGHPGEYVQPALGVPYHSHWFSYDPTDPPPPWSPRRPDWKAILVDRQEDSSVPAGGIALDDALKKSRKLLVDAINEATLTPELRSYATTEIPFGLWQAKPECQQTLATRPKVADFTGSGRPLWMDQLKAAPDAPVYMSAPGASLYRHICFNCHGPLANGRGLQADALAASSEGEARPANFREGLFGPSTQAGANLLATFGIGTPTPDMNVALGWGSRYLAWMTLGGTLKKIPEDIIHQVEATRVLGQARQNLDFLPGANGRSANMLNLAKGLCSVVLPAPTDSAGHIGFFSNDPYQAFLLGVEPARYPPYNTEDAPFIAVNGDKEMWLNLCSRFSPSVVRVYSTSPNRNVVGGYDVRLAAMYYGDSYPADAPVLDHNKVVQVGVHVDNSYPACLQPPPDAAATAWLADKPIRTKTHMPDCPPQFLAGAKVLWRQGNLVDEYQDNIARWTLRGGIATGMAVFSYLQGGGAQTQVKPYYNECQLLK